MQSQQINMFSCPQSVSFQFQVPDFILIFKGFVYT